MKNQQIIGRTKELKELNELKSKKTASLIVLWGRRRIGKSTLAYIFAKGFSRYYIFQGLGPRINQTNQHQLDYFSEKLTEYFDLPRMKFASWSQAFSTLSGQVQKGDVCVVFDEISWMGSKDKDFPGRLKTAWDEQFKTNPKLCLIVCGSVSSWIQKNILKKTDFVGRISYSLAVEELPLTQVSQFWQRSGFNIGNSELALALMVTGGVPKYLEELAVKTNINAQLSEKCFSKNGFFYQEYERIFSEIFGRRSQTFRKIIQTLCTGSLTASDLAKKIPRPLNGKLSADLKDLVMSGFISAETIYSIEGLPTDKVIYRLKDNYLRFFLKLISPKVKLIESTRYSVSDIEALPGWSNFKGQQFENLVYLSFDRIYQILSINKSKIISAGPYFQKKNSHNRGGCQIDILIHEKENKYYICEIKSGVVSPKIVKDLDLKIHNLNLPKKCSTRRVLISLEEVVPESVFDNFDKVIYFKDLDSN